MKRIWDRFIDGFCTPGTDDEGKRRVTLLVALSAIGIFNLILFGSIAILQKNLLLGTADFTAFAVLLLNLHDARRRKRTSVNILFGSVFVGVFYAFLFVSGGEKNTAFVWCYTYPLIACYLLGARAGGIAASLLLFPVLLHFLINPGLPFAVYPTALKARFFFSYLVVGGFSFLFEHTRERNREELRRTQSTLENTIGELNAARETLKASMEGALRASEERYRALFSRAPDGIFIMGTDGKLVDVNESFARMHGYGQEELLRMNISDLDTPETFLMMSERVGRIMAGEDLTFEVEHYHKDGHVFPLEVSTRLVSFGGESYIQAFHRDITERRRNEELLRESKEMLTLFIRHSPIYTFIKEVSPTGSRVLHASDNFEQMIGVPAREMRGKTMGELFPADFAAKIVADDWSVVSEGKVLRQEEDFNGRHYISIKFPIVQGDEILLGGYTIDVTEQKYAEEEKRDLERQVLEAQKMESLGVLAGGIAHDFNNLLMVVLGHAELALKDISPMSPARNSLNEISTAARRLADLSQQMLAYAGKALFSLQRVGLTELVEEMAHLLRAAISKKAVFSLNLERSLPPIKADPSQIRQIAMNLIINASEAIGDRSGVITVSAGATRCDEECLRKTELRERLTPGLYVYMEVSDTGCGMDANTRSRIFEPFFSTKFTGRGLGLAAVQGIVRAHKGALKVSSEPGKGTTFRVLFPAMEDAGEEARIHDSSPLADWRGTGTVLLVDDEESLLALGARMLELLGLTVLTAADGRQAVELYRKRGKEIDLVLMDLTMPHMDGAKAFGELCRLDADVRVVLASGYSREDVASRFEGKGPAGIIHKPYTVANLRESLARHLPMRSAGDK